MPGFWSFFQVIRIILYWPNQPPAALRSTLASIMTLYNSLHIFSTDQYHGDLGSINILIILIPKYPSMTTIATSMN